jgi:cyd operon protein YbgT
MWYFSWILGLGFAITVAIINAIWLETNYAFGQRDEGTTLGVSFFLMPPS